MALQKYKINRVMNNNVLLVTNLKSNSQRIITGKGLGFGKKTNQLIELDDKEIENRFIKFDRKLKADYFKLVDAIDESIFEVCTEVILMADDKLKDLDNKLHIVLTDHISFAIERVKNGMDITNPFLLEIKNLYSEEYEVALLAREHIHKRLGVKFNDDEVGFIALHLSSAKRSIDVKETMKHTRVLRSLVEIIEESLNYRIKNDLTYNRLINHLKGAIQRASMAQVIENPLIDTLKENFAESYKIAVRLSDQIEKDLDIKLSESERGYMTIHINRVRGMAKYNNEK